MKRAYERGFTLVELMITVLILGILAGVAIPAYSKYMEKARRSDAMASLTKLRLEQEKHRTGNATYGVLADVWSGTSSLDGYYTLAVSNNTATGYIATAAPTAGGLQVDDDCGTFAIDQDGPIYSNGGTTYADAICWKR